MAVVMCQTRKVLNTVAPDDAAATGARARLISPQPSFPPPGRPPGGPAATPPVVPG